PGSDSTNATSNSKYGARNATGTARKKSETVSSCTAGLPAMPAAAVTSAAVTGPPGHANGSTGASVSLVNVSPLVASRSALGMTGVLDMGHRSERIAKPRAASQVSVTLRYDDLHVVCLLLQLLGDVRRAWRA